MTLQRLWLALFFISATIMAAVGLGIHDWLYLPTLGESKRVEKQSSAERIQAVKKGLEAEVGKFHSQLLLNPETYARAVLATQGNPARFEKWVRDLNLPMPTDAIHFSSTLLPTKEIRHSYVAVEEDVLLISQLPIQLLSEGIGTLTLSFSLQARVGNDIPVTVGANGDPIERESSSFSPISHLLNALGERLVLLTILLISLIVAANFAILRHYFFRGFRLLLERIEETTAQISAGVLPTSRRLNLPIRELKTLSQSYERLVATLCTYQNRLIHKTRTEALGEKAAQVAHDLQGPVLALEMVLDVDNDQARTEEQRHHIKQLLQRIRSVAKAVRDNAPASLHGKPSAPALLQSALEELKLEFKPKQIEFTLEHFGESQIPDRIVPHDLARLLTNILRNAAESMPGTGVVSVTSYNAGIEWRIDIQDSGVGMDQSTLANLGTRGFTTKGERGNGLGVWGAKQTLLSWGGDLRFASVLGEGTTATLLIPFSRQSGAN